MKSEKLVLTSIVRGRKQVTLWDSSSPVGLGHPIRWVLEKVPGGVRVRTLRSQTPAQSFPESVIDDSKPFSIPSSPIQLQLKRVRPPRAAHLGSVPSASNGEVRDLMMAFSGIRHVLTSSREIHAAYLAYCKGKPIFTVQNSKEGIAITLLANKLYLKKKGQDSFLSGAPGAVWRLTREELASSTITRGWYWWRFDFVPRQAAIADARDERESSIFKKTLLAGVLAFFLLSAIFIGSKQAPQVVHEIPIELPIKTGKVFVFTQKAAPGEAKAPEAPVPAPKHAATPVHHDRAARVKEPSKAAGGQAHLKSRAVLAAERRTRVLKEAMSGMSSLVSQNLRASGGAAPLSGIFAAKGPIVSETQVKPGFAGTNVKVGEIGGRGTGGAGDSKGGAIGYGMGEHGAVMGQGKSLVSADMGGSSVDQGLSKEEVGAVIHSHMSEIRYCHEAAMLSNPTIQGELVVDFTINPSGKVGTESVKSSSLLPDQTIQNCLLRRLSSWRFPKPRGGVHVNVSYPFLFKTLSRG